MAKTGSDSESSGSESSSSSLDEAGSSSQDDAEKKKGCIHAFVSLPREVGWNTIYLGLACFFFQVSSELLARNATGYVFKQRHVEAVKAEHYSIYWSLTEMFKLVYALVSNVIPICGLTMLPYAAPGIFTMVACNAAIYAMQDSLPIDLFVGARFLTWGSINYLNLITDVVLAVKRNEKPSVGPTLYSFFSYLDIIRGVFLTLVSGRLIESYGAYMPFAVATFFSLSLVPAAVCNLYPEKRMTQEEVDARRQKFTKDKDMVYLMLSLLCISMYTLSVASMFGDQPYAQCFFVTLGTGAVCASWYAFANSDFAVLILYFALGGYFQIDLGAAAFYFCTDEEDVYPEGPHFTPFFMLTVLPFVGMALSFFGITIYNIFMTEWNFRTAIRIPLITRMLLHFVDIVQFTRFNVRLGIPDWVTSFGVSAFASGLEAWEGIVYRQIVVRQCPAGMEAAILSTFYFSTSVTGAGTASSSAATLRWFGVNPSGSVGDADAFENLWLLSVLSGLGVIVQLALVYVAIPDAPQTEQVAETREWNSGSWYSKIRDRTQANKAPADSVDLALVPM